MDLLVGYLLLIILPYISNCHWPWSAVCKIKPGQGGTVNNLPKLSEFATAHA